MSVKAFQTLQDWCSLRWLVLLFAIFLSLVFRDFESTTKGVKAPIIGRWPLEPYFLTGLRFKFRSMDHLADGYSKARFRSHYAGSMLTKVHEYSSSTRCSK